MINHFLFLIMLELTLILALNIQRNKISEAKVIDSNKVSFLSTYEIYAMRFILYWNSMILGNKTSKIGSIYFSSQIAISAGNPICKFLFTVLN